MSEDSNESFVAPRARKRHRPVIEVAAVPSHDAPIRPATWRERHFATIMGAVLGGLLIFIMIFQAAC